MNQVNSAQNVHLHWGSLSQFIEKQIDALRKRNDAVHLDPTETAYVRGQIQALKGILALPEQAAQEEAARSGPLDHSG